MWISITPGGILYPEVISMTLIEWLKAKKTLWIMAAQQGCSVADIRGAIQASIDDAWNNAWMPGNLHAQIQWQRMFPGGKKPSVEQFIVVMARKLTAGEDPPYMLG